MKIGFIGLGNVGAKLAGSLLRNGFDLTVKDIDQNLTDQFKNLGAKVAYSGKELAEQVDLIITSLPSLKVSAEVMEAENGVLEGLSENKILSESNFSLGIFSNEMLHPIWFVIQSSDIAIANPPLEQSCADLINSFSIISNTEFIFFFDSVKSTCLLYTSPSPRD